MDPISLGISAVGLGMQIFSGFSSSKASKENAQIAAAIAAQERAINDAKRRQMEIEGRRTQLQNIRNAQRARAMSVQASVSQGAQFGTGLQGGLAQVQNQMAFNMLGVDQALSIGREISGYNDNISNLKVQQAKVSSEAASAQGIASLGGALIKVAPSVGAMAQTFGGSSSSGDYTGMPWSKNTGNLY